MDSSFPKYLIINLNTIFDFSSISFALLKKLEEDKTKDYNFGDVTLASFHIKSFKDFAEKYSNGDNKKKEEYTLKRREYMREYMRNRKKSS